MAWDVDIFLKDNQLYQKDQLNNPCFSPTNSKYGIYHISDSHMHAEQFLDSKLWSTNIFVITDLIPYCLDYVVFKLSRKVPLHYSFYSQVAILSLFFWDNMYCNWSLYLD